MVMSSIEAKRAKSRSGFTMIELIFVIVILGILASVAIPKLSASRDDAKISAALTEIKNIRSEFASYYTARGVFTGDLGDVTNVARTSNSSRGGLFTDNCNSPVTASTAMPNDGTTLLHYCLPNSDGTLERIFSVTADNDDGNVTYSNSSSASGNVGSRVQSASTYGALVSDMQLGGGQVIY
jgi:prepilin-type N-terminal cleavage/methylation domain-containing protein